MKKNKMMRLAACLLVMVLLTTSMISGTFAKYTTSASSEDEARVAYWGFQTTNTMDLTGLFANAYNGTVESVDDADVIAPGTSGSSTFTFAWDESVSANGTSVAVTGPEVAYVFSVEVEEECDNLIKANKNIQWRLDNGTWGTWDQMIASIEALDGEADGNKQYDPNTLPAAFTATDDVHKIEWQWLFEGTETYTVDSNTLTQDQYDTYMGNAANLDDCSIKIIVSATQID